MALFCSVSRVNLSLGCKLLVCVEFYMSAAVLVHEGYVVGVTVPVYDLCACLLFSEFSMSVRCMLCMFISASMLEVREPIGKPTDRV